MNTWKKNKDLARKARCLKCEALKSARRQHKERYEWKQSSYACRACSRNLPPHKFNTTALQKLDMDDQIYLAICGTCEQTRDASSSEGPPVKCNLCERTLPRSSFSLSRQRLRGDYKRWRCLECDFPPCEVCGEIPTQPKNRPCTCQKCSYPPCRCGAPRKQKTAYHVSNMKIWTCPKCKKAEKPQDA